MTICEWIWGKYTEYNNTKDEDKRFKYGGIITSEEETFRHFEVFCKNICSGGYLKDLKQIGFTYEQLEKAKESKYMKEDMYKGEIAYLLTNKGIKTIWKCMNKQTA